VEENKRDAVIRATGAIGGETTERVANSYRLSHCV